MAVRLTRILLPVAAVSSLTAAGLALVDREEPPAGEVATLVAMEASHVRRVVVATPQRHADLIRRGRYWSPAPGTPVQAAGLLSSFADELLPMRAYRTVNGAPADPQYGLVPGQLTLTVEDAAGSEATVVVGGPTFTGAGAYAHRLGDPRLYLVPRRLVDRLASLVTGLPEPSADPLEARAERHATAQAEASEDGTLTPYLRQVLEAEARMPAGVE